MSISNLLLQLFINMYEICSRMFHNEIHNGLFALLVLRDKELVLDVLGQFQMQKFVINVINEWHRCASSFYVLFLPSLNNGGQLFKCFGTCSSSNNNWILCMQCILIGPDDAFVPYGIDSVTITRIVPFLSFARIHIIPIFGERNWTNHSYNLFDSFPWEPMLLKNLSSIVIVLVVGEVFPIISIMEKTR